MYELILEDLETHFPGRSFISAREVCEYVGCDMAVVYNWNKRADRTRRPPSMMVKRELRFQKRLFAKWLAAEQAGEH